MIEELMSSITQYSRSLVLIKQVHQLDSFWDQDMHNPRDLTLPMRGGDSK